MGQKIIHLVRHGQYASSQPTVDAPEGCLTDLGREQAYLVAQRLRQLPIDRIHYSSIRRAAETAHIIATEFPEVPLHSSELLWEFHWKVLTDAVQSFSGEALEQVAQTKQRIKTAFAQYFTPTLHQDDQHEVLVCHGNIIRYFVCCALQVTSETLFNMESANCGISTLVVEPTEKVMLLSYNDVGHLPLAKQTYIRHVPVQAESWVVENDVSC